MCIYCIYMYISWKSLRSVQLDGRTHPAFQMPPQKLPLDVLIARALGYASIWAALGTKAKRAPFGLRLVLNKSPE